MNPYFNPVKNDSELSASPLLVNRMLMSKDGKLSEIVSTNIEYQLNLVIAFSANKASDGFFLQDNLFCEHWEDKTGLGSESKIKRVKTLFEIGCLRRETSAFKGKRSYVYFFVKKYDKSLIKKPVNGKQVLSEIAKSFGQQGFTLSNTTFDERWHEQTGLSSKTKVNLVRELFLNGNLTRNTGTKQHIYYFVRDYKK